MCSRTCLKSIMTQKKFEKWSEINAVQSSKVRHLSVVYDMWKGQG